MEKYTQYPKQVAGVVRDQTFAVNSELFVAKATEDEEPLEVYNGFSRFVFSLINKERQSVIANIPVREIENIRELTRIAQQMDVESRYMARPLTTPAAPVKAEKAKPTDKAHTVVLTMGAFAGMTPAEAIATDPANKASLNQTYKDLARAVKANPELQDQIDAIKEAGEMLKAGTLNQEEGLGDCSAAFSVRIGNGNLKGKTPAEVLKEDPVEGKKKLENQRKWLADHLKDYPKNQAQIDAIDAGIKLFEAGKIDEQEAAMPVAAATPQVDGASLQIYDAKYHALKSKGTNANGKSFIYDIAIQWDIGRNYPVRISIVNYWAPVRQDPKTHKQIVTASEAEGKVPVEMLLAASEWNDVLRAIQTNMRQFEYLHAAEVFKDAEDANTHNRNAALSSGGSGK